MNPVIYSYVSTDFRRRFADVVLATQSCRRPSTATDQPETPTAHRRNAGYEAVALEQLGALYIELRETRDAA